MSTRFSDTQTAFALKSQTELNWAYWLFKLIGSPVLTSIGTALTNFSLKLHLPIEGLIKRTVFKQFCGGISEQDCLPVIKKMHEKALDLYLTIQ